MTKLDMYHVLADANVVNSLGGAHGVCGPMHDALNMR